MAAGEPSPAAPVLDFTCACGAAFQLEDTPRNAGFMRRLVRAHMQECDKVETPSDEPSDEPEVESLPLFGEGGQ